MKRKNRLKSSVNFCFLCGKRFYSLEDKIGHRINPKKGNNEHNLLVVCKDCKKKLIKNKIWDFKFNPEVLLKYFKTLGENSRKIILNKIKTLRNVNKI